MNTMNRQESTDVMSKPVRIGWIGAGFVGQVGHLVNYRHIPDAELTALAELRPAQRANIGRTYGFTQQYDSHSSLLAESSVDAVVAIVHRRHTFSVALDVLRAGKHLFTEKPMAQTAEQSRILAAEAQKQNLVYAVGFMRRHDDGVKLARARIAELRQSGEFGPILYARCHLLAGGDYCGITGDLESGEEKPRDPIMPAAPDWLPAELHGQFEHFVNLCSHNINLIRYLFDETPQVDYFRWRRPKGTAIGFSFNDFPLHFEHTDVRMNQWIEGVEVVFERGIVTVDLPPAFLRNQPATVRIFRGNDKQPFWETSHLDWTWSFLNQDRAFVENVRTGTQSVASGQDAVNDMILIEDIWKKL
jgi:predicted dehydrogenase